MNFAEYQAILNDTVLTTAAKFTTLVAVVAFDWSIEGRERSLVIKGSVVSS